MRLQVFPAHCSQGLCWIWSCLPPRVPPGLQPCPCLDWHSAPKSCQKWPRSLQAASPGAPISHPGGVGEGAGGGLNFNGGWLPCPSPDSPGHAKPRGCSEQPQPCMHPRWGRRGCCHRRSGGSTFPQPARIKLLALQKEAGAGQTSSRLPCHPSAWRAAEPAHPMAGYHWDPILPGK